MLIIMKKIPVTLIIDDPAPVISVYYTHCSPQITKDGRPMIRNVPNSMLFDFCDVIERHGIKGKYSVVPMPGNEGDIINGINGVDKKDMDEWIDTVKKRVAPLFSICPEVLSHNKAVDLETGKALEQIERDWASDKDRTVLTPYITKALSLLKEAGFDASGVTSPWDFGIEVEDEYVYSISKSFYDVYGKNKCWYFLRSLRDRYDAKPWVAYDEDGRSVVCIADTLRDHFWQTIDTTQNSDEFVKKIADEIITEDGKGGEMIEVINRRGYPVLITHWQSLMSNGLGTGIRALDEVGRRINSLLGDKVQWVSFEELMNMVLEDKENYPKPVFNSNRR